MTLLERESSLAALDGYADAAATRRWAARPRRRRGRGGQVGAGRAVRAASDRMHDGCGGRATGCSLRARSLRCSTSPISSVASCSSSAGPGPIAKNSSGPCCGSSSIRRRLTIVVVEDIHWADEATLDLLRFLARRVRNTPVLLIATYRDEGLAQTDPLRRGLGELVTQGISSRIELAPLSFEAVRSLAEADGLAADELYRLTGRQPVLRRARCCAPAPIEIPATTRDVILSRAARLDPDCRQALEAAALIGSRIDVGLLESVTGLRVARRRRAASHPGLLVGDGPRLRFRHEIARLAVEQAVPGLPSRSSCTPGSSPRCSLPVVTTTPGWRFMPKGRGTGRRCCATLRGPLRAQLALFSHSEAAAQYQRTLRFALAARSRPRSPGSTTNYSPSCALVDRWTEAADAGEHALELWRAVGDRLREGDALRRMVKALWRLCRGREASAAAEEALAILSRSARRVELAWAYSMLAGDRMSPDRIDEAIALARTRRR